MNRTLRYTVILSLLLTAIGSVCACRRANDKPIVVLYDNDAHCAMAGYTKLAGLREAMLETDTAYVLTVSVGDFVQGSMIGSLSHGEDVVPVLNAVGYDVLTVGNHEFDYGGAQLQQITDKMQAPVTCVNLSDYQTHKFLYAPYVVKQCGRRKVAFVGVLTPQTITAEGYSFFDADGRQLYDVHPAEVAQLTQQAVDAARREGADYVVVLAHLGESTNSYTSRQLIADTRGIDVVLDGHSHSVIPMTWVSNREGRPVCTTQTGTKFEHVGKLYISRKGQVATTLIPTQEIAYTSTRVQAVLDSIDSRYAAMKARPCGYNEQALPIYNIAGSRDVRRSECALANLITDCMRYTTGAEIAVTNGGGIRENLPEGEITYGQIFDVLPFNNEMLVASVPGSHIRAMVEKECATLPEENGMFVHPSGMRYRVVVSATPRVQLIEVQDADGEWQPLEDKRAYRVATTDYVYGQYFDGDPILQGAGIGTPRDVLYHYIQQHLGGRITATSAHMDGRIVVE